MTRRIPLQHAQATALATKLAGLMSPTCSWCNADGTWVREEIADCCVADPDANALVMRGTSEELRDLGELVAVLDESDSAPARDQALLVANYEVAFVEQHVALHYASAESLVERLGPTMTGRSLSTDVHGRWLACECFSWFDGHADHTTNTIAVRGCRYLVREMMAAIVRGDVPQR